MVVDIGDEQIFLDAHEESKTLRLTILDREIAKIDQGLAFLDLMTPEERPPKKKEELEAKKTDLSTRRDTVSVEVVDTFIRRLAVENLRLIRKQMAKEEMTKDASAALKLRFDVIDEELGVPD